MGEHVLRSKSIITLPSGIALARFCQHIVKLVARTAFGIHATGIEML
jgi:hypothetical protein